MAKLLAGSHIPILIKLVQMTDGPVLELGIGYNSTPLLHWLCGASRHLVSLEGDEKWVKKFQEYNVDRHIVKYIEDWDKADIDNTHWSVVLIDHRPALRRKVDAERLKDKADYILIHDSEPEINKFYRYTDIYPLFKYRHDYTAVKPNSVVLSNFKDLSNL